MELAEVEHERLEAKQKEFRARGFKHRVDYWIEEAQP
tara:strand:- start:269 stop:379 length:111 start_codon:yes stop_codon:yes gene_type:complete